MKPIEESIEDDVFEPSSAITAKAPQWYHGIKLEQITGWSEMWQGYKAVWNCKKVGNFGFFALKRNLPQDTFDFISQI